MAKLKIAPGLENIYLNAEDDNIEFIIDGKNMAGEGRLVRDLIVC
jgi:hypothetical protein